VFTLEGPDPNLPSAGNRCAGIVIGEFGFMGIVDLSQDAQGA
jgi:hypothetical protein